MRVTDRIYKSLVIVHTVILLGCVVLGVLIVVEFEDKLMPKVQSFVGALIGREVASSQVITAFKSGGKIDVPVYDIKIHPNDIRKIEAQVEQLIQAKTMSDDLKIWHPARFYHNDEEYKVKIRLKGDFSNHWKSTKKSWRIQFKKDKLFQGRRVIDFTIPKDKGYEVELAAYDMARELGLLVADAGFCRMRINGVDFGAYLWMEKYGKEMLEKQGYPAGEIFRYSNFWVETVFSGVGVDDDKGYGWHGYNKFTSCMTNSISDDPSVGYYAERLDRLVTLIRESDDAVFRREIPHLLNIEKFLAWNALTWTMGGTHPHQPDNLRWYYDNTSGLFEPILYDMSRIPLRTESTNLLESPKSAFEADEFNELSRRMFQLSEYRQRRNEILWRLVSVPRFNAAARCEEYFQQLRPVFMTGVALDYHVDRFHNETIKILSENRQHLREQLAFARVFVTPVARSYKGVPAIRLRLLPDSHGNINIDQIRLKFISPVAAQVKQGAIGVYLSGLDGSWDEVQEHSVLVESDDTVTVKFKDLSIWTPVDERLRKTVSGEWRLQLELSGIELKQWQTPGMLSEMTVKFRNAINLQEIASNNTIVGPVVFNLDDVSNDASQPSSMVRPVEEFIEESGLPFVKSGNVLTLPQGEHYVTEDLTVPAGFTLRLKAGTKLVMSPNVSWVCYGPLEVAGTAEQMVRIVPLDKERPWGTFAVVRAGGVSRVKHLEVEGGSEAYRNGIYLSGQLCFYWSDVEMQHCLIRGAKADDGLNVKKARITIRDCVIRDNSSDGFDADWVSGTVQSSIFLNNGGDGLDFSGSQVVVHDCLFQGMRDKGISVGEKSKILAVNNVIRDCEIGVACKDLSDVGIYASVLYHNRTAIAAYRKKQLFGGARGKAVGTLFWNNDQIVRLDNLSRFTLRSSAANEFKPSARITIKNPLRGSPSDYYALQENGSILHDSSKNSKSPFRIGLTTEKTFLEGYTVPDLAGSTAGLQRSLVLYRSTLSRAGIANSHD